jgi:hypothetical protein
MMIYVNHSKETSELCAKLVIKRKPVEFTPEEWCTRLKTTPYRERPHKCFFVHDGENKTLFPKCSQANRLVNCCFLIVLMAFLTRYILCRRT